MKVQRTNYISQVSRIRSSEVTARTVIAATPQQFGQFLVITDNSWIGKFQSKLDQLEEKGKPLKVLRVHPVLAPPKTGA